MSSPSKPKPEQTTRGKEKGGYALWQYTAGAWILKKNVCEPGYECGAPPREKGRFEGELRKTAGILGVAAGSSAAE